MSGVEISSGFDLGYAPNWRAGSVLGDSALLQRIDGVGAAECSRRPRLRRKRGLVGACGVPMCSAL
eukprot:scaffold1348_cov323-Prasinococcus_capsulatus_cf.AAC.9